MSGLPMKNSHSFTEQINVKVSNDTKENFKILKYHGVDVAQLCRSVIQDALTNALKKVESGQISKR